MTEKAPETPRAHVYTDVERTGAVQHIESLPNMTEANKVGEYVQKRLPKDRVWAEWATRRTDAKPFDGSRMREGENRPPADTDDLAW